MHHCSNRREVVHSLGACRLPAWIIMHLDFVVLKIMSFCFAKRSQISSKALRPLTEGEIRARSSAYPKWLAAFPAIWQPTLLFCRSKLNWPMYTLNKWGLNFEPWRMPLDIPKAGEIIWPLLTKRRWDEYQLSRRRIRYFGAPLFESFKKVWHNWLDQRHLLYQ